MDNEVPAARKLRVAFTESNIFARVDTIPEDGVYTRSSSMPRGNAHGSSDTVERAKDSWRISHGLKHSFTLGFLFPDDDGDDELRQSFLNDNDAEVTASPVKAPLLDDEEFGQKAPRVGMHRAQTAPAMSSMNRDHIAATLQRPRFPKGADIVFQAGMGLMVYLATGVAIYAFRTQDFSGIETMGVVDALYFCVVTMCTIGYGDIVPVTPFAKLFTCVFVLVGFGFIDALVSGMVTVVLDKQEHLLLSAVEGSHFRTAKSIF